MAANVRTQLHTSYRSLGKDLKTIFDDLVTHISAQRAESLRLRQQLEEATRTIAEQNAANASRMQEVMEGERIQAAVDRQDLLAQMTSLINAQAEVQESRLADKTAELQRSILASNTTLEKDVAAYGEGMDAWNSKEDELLETVTNSKEAMKTKLKEDWNVRTRDAARRSRNSANMVSRPLKNTVHPSRAPPSRSTPRRCAWLTSSWRTLTCR